MEQSCSSVHLIFFSKIYLDGDFIGDMQSKNYNQNNDV
jgi:hypothetical protein